MTLVVVLCDFGRFNTKLADVNIQQSIGMFPCILCYISIAAQFLIIYTVRSFNYSFVIFSTGVVFCNVYCITKLHGSL